MKKFSKLACVILAVALVAIVAVGFVACNDSGELRFAAPQGTPALAMLRLASQKTKLGAHDVNYDVVSANTIALEMGGGKADIVIMPVNAGAKQIVDNKNGYKLVSVAVEGSLYLLGHKDGQGVLDITFADLEGKKIACIGKTGVPGLIFRYVMGQNDLTPVEGNPDSDPEKNKGKVFVEYVDDGNLAVQRYIGADKTKERVDFIVVGEPVATVQKNNDQNDINAEMDLQVEYGKVSGVTGADNYPQAGLFVRAELLKEADFLRDLFKALDDNKDWIKANPDKVTAEAASIGSTTPFPKPALQRCALDCDELDADDVAEILQFLKNMVPSVDWAANKDAIFAQDLLA